MVVRELDLLFFYEFFKRNVLVIILAGLVAGGAAFGISRFLLPKRYSSHASIFIGRIESLTCTNKQVERTFSEDLLQLCKMYHVASPDGETPDAGGEPDAV
jgi:capsular polysaccharide biosynthesis protein